MLSQRPFECPSALLARAKALPPVATAIANAGAALPMESARMACEAEIIEPLLVGDTNAIAAEAERMGWNISGLRIVPAASESEAADAAAALCRDGAARVLMKGHLHTDAFMLGMLKRDSGLRTGRRLTHVFHMTVPGDDTVLLITDAAINVSPDITTRIQAAQSAVDLAHALGIDRPKVAVLSATEEVTPKMPSSLEAAEIADRAREGLRGADIHGPLALDLAVSPDAAAVKGIDNPVAGNADILLVPNIETGNALFKMMVYFMSACAAGIVLGAKVPAILTSRADPPEARLAAAAIASILANRSE
ncbi:MAG: bifunctional enoyl-CoA hydratase/phosphate acetyltransferase [Alphaproteobacteria bacterium]|nr:bifunctional enoyl-CoA hydratase/phosphate acetyltransferase [Alphaproteobacteria bacterium]